MVNGADEIGVRVSICASVFIVGAGASGGVSGPWANRVASAAITRMARNGTLVFTVFIFSHKQGSACDDTEPAIFRESFRPLWRTRALGLHCCRRTASDFSGHVVFVGRVDARTIAGIGDVSVYPRASVALANAANGDGDAQPGATGTTREAVVGDAGVQANTVAIADAPAVGGVNGNHATATDAESAAVVGSVKDVDARARGALSHAILGDEDEKTITGRALPVTVRGASGHQSSPATSRCRRIAHHTRPDAFRAHQVNRAAVSYTHLRAH